MHELELGVFDCLSFVKFLTFDRLDLSLVVVEDAICLIFVHVCLREMHFLHVSHMASVFEYLVLFITILAHLVSMIILESAHHLSVEHLVVDQLIFQLFEGLDVGCFGPVFDVLSLLEKQSLLLQLVSSPQVSVMSLVLSLLVVQPLSFSQPLALLFQVFLLVELHLF